MGDKQRQREPFRVRLIIGLRTYGKEVLAAAIVVALVVGVAFGVNKFFYGFDSPLSTSSTGSAPAADRESKGGRAEKKFVQSKDWKLILVNADHPLEGAFDGELTELRYGERVDSRIYPDLQRMFDQMREEGLSPRVMQGYRTGEEQKKRLDNKIKEYMGYGKSREEARELALQWEQEPGTTEHEIGICVDVSSETGDNETANAVWKWMDANCAQFGFIKRYPTGKSAITGVKGEPWHYRYVGEEAAQEIMERGITLEEYLGAL